MSQLVGNFLKEQQHTLEISDLNSVVNDTDTTGLAEQFLDYVYKVYFYGYVKKTILYSSIQLKQKNSLLRNREELSLNTIDFGFTEERINLLTDTTGDFTEQLNLFHPDDTTYQEICHDAEIIKAVNSLTDRQKEILNKCILFGESDTTVANKLGVSKQAIGKIKRTALNKLRKQLGYSHKRAV